MPSMLFLTSMRSVNRTAVVWTKGASRTMTSLLRSTTTPTVGSCCRRGYRRGKITSIHYPARSLLLFKNNNNNNILNMYHHQTVRKVTTIALLRETYNVWERRAPLTPSNVQTLLKTLNDENHHPNPGRNTERLRILVQPSTRRIFTNEEYEDAGAIITDDLHEADVLMSVKLPKDPNSLLPNKSYMFFSHTIKGQDENMQLLKTCLDHKIQLLDYERMMQPTDNGGSSDKRLVSFGKYAGIAGAIDSMAAIGKRLLYTHGINSPFLNCPPSWQYDSLQDAEEYVRALGERLQHPKDGRGLFLPDDEPLILAVTGQGGKCFGGVMSILSLLPHQFVSVEDLPNLMRPMGKASNKTYAATAGHTPPICIVPVNKEDVFVRLDGAPFDRQDFYHNPLQYRSLFHHKVAPYAHVVYNCVYWDERFPRLLSKNQTERLYRDGRARLMLVADITCDVHGSMEFLERTTTIESPFFQYDPHARKEVANEVRADGITVLGVDILPSELPRDSSEHFGSALVNVVQELLSVREKQDKDIRGIDPNLLSPSLADSCITTVNGTLSSTYRYLQSLLDRSLPKLQASAKHPSMLFALEGHLFDSGLINQILDVIEAKQAGLQFEECTFPRMGPAFPTLKSKVLLRVSAEDLEKLKKIESKIYALVDIIEKAQAEVKRVDQQVHWQEEEEALAGATSHARVCPTKREKRVLLLGSGLVSKTVVQFLGRSDGVRITVVGDQEEDAKIVAAAAPKGQHVPLDLAQDIHELSDLIDDADVVISLLPAPFHPTIAQECILHHTDLVTASYESQEMRDMNDRAQDAGIVILNEVGLDPGLDHMSSMRIIHDIIRRGGFVTGFQSVCGGLPSPEAANNPLRYKFSWSPRGVIRASQNSARYRRNFKTIEIPGHELLTSAQPFPKDIWPDLQLECLPNRDSLSYEEVYSILDAETIFRGTLRYKGWASLMHVFKNMGLFDEHEVHVADDNTWTQVFNALRMRRGGGFESMQDFVEACADGDHEDARRAMDALEWLGVLGDEKVANHTSVVDAFCKILEQKLHYEEEERDMVVMYHKIEAGFDDGTTEDHTSSLRVLGDSTASAMAKTVGYTTAACAELILDGSLKQDRGLLLPIEPKVYLPVLEKVEREGIHFDESVFVHSPPAAEQNA